MFQLVCLAVEQNREGKSALTEFIANENSKVDEALAVAKEFSEAKVKFLRSKTSGEKEIASKFVIGRGLKHTVLYIALKKSRGKYRNVFIHGPANSGKTFILSPLKVIYETFCNPATGTFAWLGAEEAEVIFLNDFK